MGDAAPVRGLVVPFRAPQDNEQRIGKGGEQGAQTREEKERTSFARLREPKEQDRTGKPEETRGPNPGQSQAPARPRPPRRNLRSLPSSPRRSGRGASTKDSNFRAGTGPPPTPGRGPYGRQEASCECQEARGERGWPGAGDLGRRAWEGAQRKGAESYSGSQDSRNGLKKRVSKNRQRLARGGEEGKGTRNSPPVLLRSGPRPPLTRAEVWRKPRGTEGDGASALGRREGTGGPGRHVRSPSTRAKSRDRFRPLGFPRLRAPRRSRAPPH